ncbi:hypothetical protein K440DRAFT_657447 [Wilcoxina mikolae CBS 423.85]|nr:hypothetical protein K440DRAFT_657447 [Wilcoxina mikolae CBS 423.85]
MNNVICVKIQVLFHFIVGVGRFLSTTISIRLPSESHSPPSHYSYRHRSTILSPRIWRRILPVTLLFILAVESYRFFIASQPPPPPPATIPPEDDIFDLGPPLPDIKNLVVVGCHAIWKGGPTHGRNESEWVMQPFQRGREEQETFIAHVTAGVEAAKKDPNSLLVFSGGETRVGVGPRMEAPSYFELAVARGLLTDALLNRTTTEIGALDSFQNLLFSVMRFHELTGIYPQKITVVSYAFKKRRYIDLHRRAIRFPVERFTYLGIDPPFKDPGERESVMSGEQNNAVTLWNKDPYACKEEGLRGKRRGRNLGRRHWGYRESAGPEVLGLLGWCDRGGRNGEWFEGRLPWTELERDERP